MKTINCTAVILVHSESKNKDYKIIQILAHDAPSLPKSESSTYKGENKFWPLHVNYASKCGLQLGKRYLCNLTIESQAGYSNPNVSVTQLVPLSPLEAMKATRELSA
jgi:hypothetical protein